jgi:thiol:disulfide interchange protein
MHKVFILLLLLTFTGCKTVKHIQQDKTKTETSVKLDSTVTDDGIEYSETERIYEYSSDAKPVRVKENIKKITKAKAKVQVKKDIDATVATSTKAVKIEREKGTLKIQIIILVLVFAAGILYWKFK